MERNEKKVKFDLTRNNAIIVPCVDESRNGFCWMKHELEEGKRYKAEKRNRAEQRNRAEPRSGRAEVTQQDKPQGAVLINQRGEEIFISINGLFV